MRIHPQTAESMAGCCLAALRAAGCAILALAHFSATATDVHAALEIVVPAYFYPSDNSPWDDMTAAADEIPITAIMNPGNGPGSFKDNNYVAAVNAFRAAGGRVIGYVHSSYGLRSLALVTADIDKYKAWYGIDGIFVDEMANTGPAERLNYYKAIYDHVKSVDPEWEVMGNPGTSTIEQYATWPAADRLMVFENVGAAYPGYAPSAWNAEYDNEMFVHLVHTEASTANMQTFLELAVQRNTGGIYITNDVMNNPWDTLPSYWQAEVAAVAQINNSFMAGDFNEDGHVDGDDLMHWKTGFGQFTTGAAHDDGDATGDGTVNGDDFLQWQRELGHGSLSASAASIAIPEPAAILMAAISFQAVARLRRIRTLR
jgi:hypothetical protein